MCGTRHCGWTCVSCSAPWVWSVTESERTALRSARHGATSPRLGATRCKTRRLTITARICTKHHGVNTRETLAREGGAMRQSLDKEARRLSDTDLALLPGSRLSLIWVTCFTQSAVAVRSSPAALPTSTHRRSL